jgi:hypothetical protein
MLAPLLALALLAPPADPPGKAPAAAALEERRAEVARQVLRLAGRLQREIQAGDAAALAARVPPEGLRCGDQLVPRAHVERDLRTEGSWLHAALFGGPGAAAAPGRPGSLRALLSTAREVAAVISFRPDPRSELGIPCLEFRTRDAAGPEVPLCFEQRAGRWWFTQSLYPC